MLQGSPEDVDPGALAAPDDTGSSPGTPRRRRSGLVRRSLRALSLVLIVGGLLAIIWAIVVWQWQDPVTAVYTEIQQHRLATDYKHVVERSHPVMKVANSTLVPAVLAKESQAYRRSLRPGNALGRITIPRIGLNMVVVQGTDESSLEKGPGHYLTTGLPGGGSLIYIAGHRTTFLAPFANINDIRVGDSVQLAVPYGTFTYRVVRHYIVPSNDLAMLVDHGREVLRLQACHPRFFATNRYIVDAVPVSVVLPSGRRYALGATAGRG